MSNLTKYNHIKPNYYYFYRINTWYFFLEMDLQNLENYPVYILNVVPELSEETNVQIPQQITSNEPLSYNFYVPNVEQHMPLLDQESVQQVISQNNINKSIKKQSYEKAVVHKSGAVNNQKIELVIQTKILLITSFKYSLKLAINRINNINFF